MTINSNHSKLNIKHAVLGRLSKKLPTIAIMLLAACFASNTLHASTSSDLNVVSSIKPIQLISTAIIGDLGESGVLLPPSANPHNYQLKPSQRSRLNNADLFVWVGPELELFLVKVLNITSVKQLSLTKVLELQSSENDEKKLEPNNEHYKQDHDHDNHNHITTGDDGSFDPHIWLNPELTRKIATAIYQQLAAQYPQLEPQLKSNLNQFLARLSKAEETITELFESKKQIEIYTFHQAFTHFADHYGLKIAGTITRTPEARPGAKHLSELANEIRQQKRICLIKEPNFKAPYIDSITRGTEVIVTTADPLANDIDNSETGYLEFIKSIANSFASCLE